MTTDHVQPTAQGPEGGRRLIGFLVAKWSGMPFFFAVISVAGLVCGATGVLYALSGVGFQGIHSTIRSLPGARILQGVYGFLAIAMALGILLRHRWGLVPYAACLVYACLVMPLYYLSHAHKWQIGLVLMYTAPTAFLLVYGWLRRSWFR